MTEIYTVIHDNRSQDLGIFPFINNFKAIEFAAKLANEIKDEDFELDEEDFLPETWLYHVVYSSEGDRIFVEVTELDDTG